MRHDRTATSPKRGVRSVTAIINPNADAEVTERGQHGKAACTAVKGGLARSCPLSIIISARDGRPHGAHDGVGASRMLTISAAG